MAAPSASRLGASRAAMAAGLAYLYGTGGILVLLTLALPHREDASELALAAIALTAVAISAMLLARGRDLPPTAYAGGVALGAALVGLCLWWGGAGGRVYAALYVWVAIYACYFFGPRLAGAMVAWSFLVHVVVLAVRDVSPAPWVDGTMVLGTSVVAGTLVGRLAGQVRGRAADLDAAARLANAMGAVPDLGWARRAICGALVDACGADAVAFVEGPGATTAEGDADLAGRLAGRPEVAAARERGERVPIPAEARTLRVQLDGLAQPVVRDGTAVAVLVVGWHGGVRAVSDRAATAASLFAAEASVVLEREEWLSGERERRALEINDSIVQGLVVAKYALAAGREEDGAAAVDRTLDHARALMDGQLDRGRPAGPAPGDLRRASPGTVH